jgi:hypothetical protein
MIVFSLPEDYSIEVTRDIVMIYSFNIEKKTSNLYHPLYEVTYLMFICFKILILLSIAIYLRLAGMST